MEIQNKVEFETVLKTLVLKKVSAKMLAEQKELVAYIDSQISQYGAEKHLAFLKRVFHNQKVSATQFFKTLKNVKANADKKNETKAQSNKTESKKTETKAQSNKTESKKNDNKKQPSSERSSLKDYAQLENEVTKLVDNFNAQWSSEIDVEVVMSYEYRVKKTTTIR
ncbi:MAG: hypothetical protein M0R51_18210 [Clostridia bacterium]|jgi:Sec-independent protein translocase protein TatA|nr:hypothetical protein [Clostridia bacterium]